MKALRICDMCGSIEADETPRETLPGVLMWGWVGLNHGGLGVQKIFCSDDCLQRWLAAYKRGKRVQR